MVGNTHAVVDGQQTDKRLLQGAHTITKEVSGLIFFLRGTPHIFQALYFSPQGEPISLIKLGFTTGLQSFSPKI